MSRIDKALMEKLSVAVVIPVFNEEKYLKACLDALSRQTLLPDIVFIVDNNSTDTSVSIASEYRFVNVVREPHQGICAATKHGLDRAAMKFDLLLRCDADCRPEKDWIEKVVVAFAKRKNTVAVTGPGIVYDAPATGRVLFDWFYMKPYFFFVGLALKRKPLFGSNFAIRSSTWSEVSSRTHLSDYQDIHDDIDISYHLPMEGLIEYERTLRMPISARPFKSVSKMGARYKAGFKSIFLHWPEQAPWKIRP